MVGGDCWFIPWSMARVTVQGGGGGGGAFRGAMEVDGEQHGKPQEWCHGPLPCLDEGCNLSSIGPDAACHEATDEAHDHGTQECLQVMEIQC